MKYTVTVPGFRRWPTGRIGNSVIRRYEIEEEDSVIGGLRAITTAYVRATSDNSFIINEEASAHISPNPAERK